MLPPPEGPCHYCEDRHCGCHANCRAYTEWLAEYKAARAPFDKEHQQRIDIGEVRHGKKPRRRKIKD